jgi:hypothetical protein
VKRHRSFVIWIVLFTLSLPPATSRADEKSAGARPSAVVTISNVKPRRDIEGTIIDAHDGCLHKFGNTYFFYGTTYGKSDGFGKSNYYRCYSSPDLVTWKLEGDVFQDPPPGVYYRPYVVYNVRRGKYVL